MLTAKLKIAVAVLLFGMMSAGTGAFVAAHSAEAGKLAPPVHQKLQASAAPASKPTNDPNSPRFQLVIASARNLRLIGKGLLLWSNEHHGKYPPDLGALIRDENGIGIERFVNPAGGRTAPKNLTRAEQAKWVDAHSDYIYVGAGLDGNATSGPNAIQPFTLLAYEKAMPGLDGINMLYGDGHVQIDNFDLAEEEISRNAKARHGAPTTQP